MASIFCLSGCSESDNAANSIHKNQETLVITSSTQFLPLVESLARNFREANHIPVVVKGSLGQELELLNKELTDLVITSQQSSSPKEEPDYLNKNQQIKVQTLAFDETVLVGNPKIGLLEINQDDLLQVFEGKKQNWQELGKSQQRIQILARESGSAIRKSFEKTFLGAGKSPGSKLSLSALVLNSNSEMKNALSRIPGSLGYMSSGSLDDTVQKIEVFQKSASGKQFIKSPKVKVVTISLNKSPESKLKSFLEFLNSAEAQEIIRKEGYLIK